MNTERALRPSLPITDGDDVLALGGGGVGGSGVRAGTPHAEAPPGLLRRRPGARLLAAATAVGVGLVILTGCGEGGGASSVSCSGDDCRATVTAAPVGVSEPSSSASSSSSSSSSSSTRTKSAGSTTTKTRSASVGSSSSGSDDPVDFRVPSMAPGSVEIADDGIVTRVPVGATFVEDDATVRLESSDGRTAVLTWTR